MPTDPRIERLELLLAARSPRRLARTPEGQEAAVSVILRPREDLEVLLVQRALRDADPWSGHVGLPGGRRHPDDADLLATALRETEEETGVSIATHGRALGCLDEVEPATPGLPPIVIAPLVAAVPPETGAVADGREVTATLWVPLDTFRDPEARAEHLVEREDFRRVFPAIRLGDRVVWGLTHRILTAFLEVAASAGL
ncbi:MAG: NUDIX hydrolase [Gemmatimonadota bacterium]